MKPNLGIAGPAGLPAARVSDKSTAQRPHFATRNRRQNKAPLVPSGRAERAEAIAEGVRLFDLRVANRPRLVRPPRLVSGLGLEPRPDDARREAHASRKRGVNDTRAIIHIDKVPGYAGH